MIASLVGRFGRVALVSSAALSACSEAPEGPDAPNDTGERWNVVLVSLDTTRADYLSSYGSEPGATPTLDALARRGVRFERAYTPSALTPVAHASLLTGLYQYNHGLRVSFGAGGYRLDPGQATLATRLKAAGYSTAAVHSSFTVSSWFGLTSGYDHLDSFDDFHAAGEVSSTARRADETTDLALAALAELREPYFLWVHYWDPHDPMQLPEPEYLARLASQRPPSDMGDPAYAALYAVEIAYMDAQLGRLIAGLEARDGLERTLLVVTADHGQGLYDGVERHGWAKHRVLYREQMHVPLIVCMPGVAPGTVSAPVSLVDVVPTVLDALGMDDALTLDGISVLGLIEDGAAAPRRTLYADQINGYDEKTGLGRKRPEASFLFVVCDEAWKLIYRPHMPERSELFHLAEDPFETNDVRAAHPDQYLRLLADLARRNPWVTQAFEGDDLDEAAGLALESLGYSDGDEPAGQQRPRRAWVWSWMCPAHEDFRATSSGEHTGECGRALVPRAERVRR